MLLQFLTDYGFFNNHELRWSSVKPDIIVRK
jgi:hypothetical protein